jgi:hypothetical protein
VWNFSKTHLSNCGSEAEFGFDDRLAQELKTLGGKIDDNFQEATAPSAMVAEKSNIFNHADCIQKFLALENCCVTTL